MGLRPRLRHVLVPLLGVALLGAGVTAAAADRGGALRGIWTTAVSSHSEVEKSPKPTQTSRPVDESPDTEPTVIPPSKPSGGNPPPPNPPKPIPCLQAGAAASGLYCPPCPPIQPQANGNLICQPCPRIEGASPAILCRPCLPIEAASPAILCDPCLRVASAAPTIACRICPPTPAAITSCWPCPDAQGAAIVCRPLVPPPTSSGPPSTKGPTGRPQPGIGGAPQAR